MAQDNKENLKKKEKRSYILIGNGGKTYPDEEELLPEADDHAAGNCVVEPNAEDEDKNGGEACVDDGEECRR